MIEVRILANDWAQLEAVLLSRRDVETKAFMLAQPVEHGAELALVVSEIVSVPEIGYAHRSGARVTTEADFVRGLLERCLDEGLALIEAHTHPWGPDARFSSIDLANDPRKFAATASILPPPFPFRHASLVFGNDMGFDGHAYDPHAQRIVPVDRIKIVGKPYRVLARTGADLPGLSTAQARVFDRQIRGFGEDGQVALGGATVGVVGCGGLGSHVAQQLALLGVGRLVLVDPDRLEESNANRVVGVSSEAVGRKQAKVHAVADGIRRACVAQPRLHVLAVPAKRAAQELLWCDVIVGAVDCDEARDTLNVISLAGLVPYIDAGVGLRADKGRFADGGGQIRLHLPGTTACRACYADTSTSVRQATPAQRVRAQASGYVLGEEVKTPQVVFLNGVVASSVVWETVKLLTGMLPPASYVYYSMHDVESGAPLLFPVDRPRRDDCFFCSTRETLGGGLPALHAFAGDATPGALPAYED